MNKGFLSRVKEGLVDCRAHLSTATALGWLLLVRVAIKLRRALYLVALITHTDARLVIA